jgi:hypothetical protein
MEHVVRIYVRMYAGANRVMSQLYKRRDFFTIIF